MPRRLLAGYEREGNELVEERALSEALTLPRLRELLAPSADDPMMVDVYPVPQKLGDAFGIPSEDFEYLDWFLECEA